MLTEGTFTFPKGDKSVPFYQERGEQDGKARALMLLGPWVLTLCPFSFGSPLQSLSPVTLWS